MQVEGMHEMEEGAGFTWRGCMKELEKGQFKWRRSTLTGGGAFEL